jgi:hypothetical protein
MYFHKEIFKTADVIVSPMTGSLILPLSAFPPGRLYIYNMMKLLVHACSVTAYTLQDDALQTGELDYINGGKSPASDA